MCGSYQNRLLRGIAVRRPETRLAIFRNGMQHHSHSDLGIETGHGHDRITMMDTNVRRNLDLVDDARDDGTD